MASAQDLRKRIKSVTNTQQITKAMKMVASARLRRAQTKAEATRPYAEKIGQILRHMSNSDLEGFESPLLDVRPVERTCYIVVGADKGLAGAFSSNVLKFAMEELKGKDPSTYRVITAGRKPRDSISPMRAFLINHLMNMLVLSCMKHFHYTNVMKLTKSL